MKIEVDYIKLRVYICSRIKINGYRMIFLQQMPVVDEDRIIQTTDSLKNATEQFMTVLKDDPQTAFNQLVHIAIDFGLKVLAAIVVYIIGIWLIRRVKKSMNRRFERKHTDKTIASFTNSLISVVLTTLVIILCISTLGVNTTSLAALLAAGGMAIGMALSGTLQNFAGGIMLLVFKPFKVGDYIAAQGFEGTVSEVNMVSTKLLTNDNRVIIIPNGALSSGNIENQYVKDSRRIDYLVPMDHGTDADAFINDIKSLISKESRVFDSFVALNNIDTNCVEFVVKLWVKSADYWPVFHDFYKSLYVDLTSKNYVFAANRLNINEISSTKE